MITLITGGERSGKSSYASELALKQTVSPVYLATARIWDDDFRKRIDNHKALRSTAWINIEEEKNLSKHDFTSKTVVLDCVTLWLTNIYTDLDGDLEQALAIAKKEWDTFIKQEMNLFVITNEIGMSLHAENPIGRKFVELQGWMNQYIAKQADHVILMVSGIAVKIK